MIILAIIIIYFIYKALGYNNSKPSHITLIKSSFVVSPEWEETIIYNNRNIDTEYINGISLLFNLYLYNSPENDHWNSRPDEEKPILNCGNTPLIAYNPIENYLSFDFMIQNNLNTKSYQKIIIKDIPVQQSLQILFTIQGRDFELFINGKLTKKTQLDGFPIYEKSDIILGKKNHNIIGKLGSMYLWNRGLERDEILEII